MASESCCSQFKEEQLYMLEFLVDRLNLTTEKISEIGSKPLTVRLEFLDFPAFEINEAEFWSSKKRNEAQTTLSNERKNANGSLDFSAGKSCLFPKKPNDLVNAMRSKPLKIAIYKTTVRKICSKEQTDFAVCKSEVPLSGCLCDQVSMSMNDATHLPEPYTLRNTWNLIDDEGKPSGTILLFLRLTCLGKSIVTQFAMKNQSVLFKNFTSSNEFQCSKVPSDENNESRGEREPEVNLWPKPRSVIGLVSICQELAKRDGGPLEVVPLTKLSICRIMEEKMPQKRDIPQKTSIKDDICFCRQALASANRVIEEFPCRRENCSRGLCTGVPSNVQSFDRNRQDVTTTNKRYNGICCSGDSRNYFYESRMRGGGPWNAVTSGSVVDCEPTNNYRQMYEDQIHRYSGHSKENLHSGACESTVKTGSSSKKPGCGCFGKLGTGATRLSDSRTIERNFGCSSEPCRGIDCLIRAFKETENFVDSIGKIPGLAGLGLMDPRESPYFGRERDDRPTSCDVKFPISVSPTKFPLTTQHQRGHLSGKFDTKTTIGTNVTDHISALHRDQNVHQLEATSLNFVKSRKKIDEKTTEKQGELQEPANHETFDDEKSPCGETICRSRRKKEKSSSNGFNEEKFTLAPTKIQEITKIVGIPKKSLNSRRTRQPKQRERLKSLMIQGPAGDRASYRRKSRIRVSKRIMRIVNKYGNTRFCHGHKNCLDVRLRVPGNMGWLWNTGESPGRLKTPIGWKPGAISRFIWKRLQQAKNIKTLETTMSSSSDVRATTATSKEKRNRAMKSKSFNSMGRGQWAKNRMNEQDDDEIELPPTLHVHRKDGTYYVTMYPVKIEQQNDQTMMEENLKPLQFKVTKNRDNEDMDSSSTGSDMEIEFSPPAALNRYRKKEPVRDQDTQVNQQEILDELQVTSVKRQSKTKKVKTKK